MDEVDELLFFLLPLLPALFVEKATRDPVMYVFEEVVRALILPL